VALLSVGAWWCLGHYQAPILGSLVESLGNMQLSLYMIAILGLFTLSVALSRENGIQSSLSADEHMNIFLNQFPNLTSAEIETLKSEVQLKNGHCREHYEALTLKNQLDYEEVCRARNATLKSVSDDTRTGKIFICVSLGLFLLLLESFKQSINHAAVSAVMSVIIAVGGVMIVHQLLPFLHSGRNNPINKVIENINKVKDIYCEIIRGSTQLSKSLEVLNRNKPR